MLGASKCKFYSQWRGAKEQTYCLKAKSSKITAQRAWPKILGLKDNAPAGLAKKTRAKDNAGAGLAKETRAENNGIGCYKGKHRHCDKTQLDHIKCHQILPLLPLC